MMQAIIMILALIGALTLSVTLLLIALALATAVITDGEPHEQ
jgi:hypothetical protein